MTSALSTAALTEKLRALVSRAVAITMGEDTTTDAAKLLEESNSLWGQVAEHPREMLPIITTMTAELAAQLAHAPDAVKEQLAAYRDAAAAAKFDWIEPPRAVVAFMVFDALERIGSFCASR